jgi:protein gp37
MADRTGIEWTDATWNPIRGCARISPGCLNCYAEKVAARFNQPGQPYANLVHKSGAWNGNIRVVDDVMDQPLRWQRPRRIFVNSMSDLFYERLPVEQIARIFAVMCLAKRHTFQVLTKRADRMRAVLGDPNFPQMVLEAAEAFQRDHGIVCAVIDLPAPNIWLGVSVENQPAADQRISDLLATPATVRWISAEPLIDRVVLDPNWLTGANALDWVVAGGESGPNARPMNPAWARALRDQCVSHDVAFLFKQWGEHAPGVVVSDPEFHGGAYIQTPRGRWAITHATDFGDGSAAARVGKRVAGRLLDGVTWDQYPVSPVSGTSAAHP